MPSRVGAWTVASMAYTASNDSSGNDICYSYSQCGTDKKKLIGESYHEVALDEPELVGQALLLGIVCRALNLVIVVVEAGDVAAGELCDLAGGTTNTAANV